MVFLCYFFILFYVIIEWIIVIFIYFNSEKMDVDEKGEVIYLRLCKELLVE